MHASNVMSEGSRCPNDKHTAACSRANVMESSLSKGSSALGEERDAAVSDDELLLSQAFIFHDSFLPVIYLLDAKSIARLGKCCSYLKNCVSSKAVLSWVGTPRVRGITSLSCIEHLRIFELITGTQNSIQFEWGSTHLSPVSVLNLQTIADILQRHPNLNIKVEGHCGLEAPPSVAGPFSQVRAKAVAMVLTDLVGDPARVSYEGFGSTKPLVCLCGPFHVGAVANRRTELFLYDDSGQEFPPRKPAPEFSKQDMEKAVEDNVKQRNEFQNRVSFFTQFCYENDMLPVMERIRTVRSAGAGAGGEIAFLDFFRPLLTAFENGKQEEKELMKMIKKMEEEVFPDICFD